MKWGSFLTLYLTNYLFYFFVCFCKMYASFHWYFIMRKRSILLEPLVLYNEEYPVRANNPRLMRNHHYYQSEKNKQT